MTKNSGGRPADYFEAGEEAYKTNNVARGIQDAPFWRDLVWADQYAWCEVARVMQERARRNGAA